MEMKLLVLIRMILDANDIGFLILKKKIWVKQVTKFRLVRGKQNLKLVSIESMVFYAILNRSGVLIVILLGITLCTSVRSV